MIRSCQLQSYTILYCIYSNLPYCQFQADAINSLCVYNLQDWNILSTWPPFPCQVFSCLHKLCVLIVNCMITWTREADSVYAGCQLCSRCVFYVHTITTLSMIIGKANRLNKAFVTTPHRQDVPTLPQCTFTITGTLTSLCNIYRTVRQVQ